MPGIRDQLAAAQKAAVESTGLVKPVATTAASAQAKATTSTLHTGMVSSASAKAKVVGVEKLPLPSAVKPKKLKPEDVIFKSNKPNLGFFWKDSERVNFRNTWFMTSNPSLLEFLRNEVNQKHYGYKEDKEEVTK